MRKSVRNYLCIGETTCRGRVVEEFKLYETVRFLDGRERAVGMHTDYALEEGGLVTPIEHARRLGGRSYSPTAFIDLSDPYGVEELGIVSVEEER